MATEFCPSCDEYLTFADALQGKVVICEICGSSFAAPPPFDLKEYIVGRLIEVINICGLPLVRKAWREVMRRRHFRRSQPTYPEEWRSVVEPPFNQTHYVSNWGNVKRIGGNNLTPDFGHEYLRVSLYFDSEYKAQREIHLLVWEAFHGPVPAGEQINHKDRDKHNPVIDNLEPLPPSKNKEHQHATEPVFGG
ncbi:HNH endonuclease signature motif containing protein [Anatilimnocola sp. NA78]|uniref:HNH endonuclease signature motif containing protein n=1 Tax=Anatilimnocola sp. NA78 TaxID=3415683 RepID=UPI003CE4E051